MAQYSKILTRFLSEHPLTFPDTDSDGVLDLLWHSYTEEKPIDHAAIRGHFDILGSICETLPLEQNDLLFSATCQLCVEYEQSAFREGVLVGMHLCAEVFGVL